MTDNLWSAVKSFTFGRRCSVCGKMMRRSVDGFQGLHVVVLNQCTECGVYLSENNYRWSAVGYDLSENCFLHISTKEPCIGEIYGPFEGGMSYVIFDVVIDRYDLNKQQIEQINKKIRHFMLLT